MRALIFCALCTFHHLLNCGFGDHSIIDKENGRMRALPATATVALMGRLLFLTHLFPHLIGPEVAVRVTFTGFSFSPGSKFC